MSRYTGSIYKQSRHLGFSVLENGKELVKKPYAPGQHGQDRRKKSSDYGIQLNEKQKVRFMYGVSEKQFRKYFDMAAATKEITGEMLLQILESRLDNIIYRLGYGSSRAQARMLVTHGAFEVNGQKVDIPSYLVKAGDVISVREIRKDNGFIKANVEANAARPVPEWLQKDAKSLSGKVVRLPSREDIDLPVEEHLIVELYSK